MRDISRVYEGLLQSTLDKFDNKAKFIRLWRNEVSRVFGDRLINNEDKELVNGQLIVDSIKEQFGDVAETACVDPILFGDYSLS